MKEIKFRVFDKIKNKIITSNFDIEDLMSGILMFSDKLIFSQFTGLKDKNNVDIYEGDIDKNGLFVKYNQLHCCFGLFNKNGFVKDIIADVYDKNGNTVKTWKTSNIEVIGNIHENKNLK